MTELTMEFNKNNNRFELVEPLTKSVVMWYSQGSIAISKLKELNALDEAKIIKGQIIDLRI